MKVNKKVIASTGVVLGVAALVAGGTIAYFTDKDAATNTFTVGSVKVKLYESQLHRQNSGRMGNFPALASDEHYCDWNASQNVQTIIGNNSLINGSYDNAAYCTPNTGTTVGYADDITAVKNGHTASGRSWGYSDEDIITDAGTYKDDYFDEVANSIVPGQWVRKFSYVENQGDSDAYILIRYMIPSDYYDKLEVKVPHTPYDDKDNGHFSYFTAVTGTDCGTDDSCTYAESADYKTPYTQTIGEKEYKVFAAVTNQPLESGEMTFWSPVNTIRIKKTATMDDFASLPASRALDVEVDAQAIQASGFADAIEAINEL